jgi:hypothetical protein
VGTVFNYDPSVMRRELKDRGYAHLKKILSDDFVADLKTFYQSVMGKDDAEIQDWKIAGKKRQFVFDFPSEQTAREFRDGMTRLTGYKEGEFTISERHLKVYDAKADPFPAPHKDRSASQYSIGIPVIAPEGTSVCIFPDLEPGPNPSPRAMFFAERPNPDLKNIYETQRTVLLNETVGDLVIFLGSALYHERVCAAGAAVLYIKANNWGEDPLGENSLAALEAY